MKINPCPFCGSEDIAFRNEYMNYVECLNCNTYGPVEESKIYPEKWNTRVSKVWHEIDPQNEQTWPQHMMSFLFAIHGERAEIGYIDEDNIWRNCHGMILESLPVKYAYLDDIF